LCALEVSRAVIVWPLKHSAIARLKPQGTHVLCDWSV